MDIRSDRQKGLSYVVLGEKYHMDPRTAKRYAGSPQNAFWYFGGYPEDILYDNMKQVVIKRLLKQEDSTLKAAV